MGGKVETVEHGGRPAGPLAEDFVKILQNFLQTGQFGTVATPSTREGIAAREQARINRGIFGAAAPHLARDPKFEAMFREAEFGPGSSSNAIGRSLGAFDTINKLISGTDITGMGKSLESIIESDIGRNVADLRERFTAGGGGGIGTPEAVAESLFRSEALPRKTMALGQLDIQSKQQQLAALMPLLQLIAQMSGMGIPQAQSSAFFDPGAFAQFMSGLGGVAKGVAGVAGAGGAGGG